MESKIVSKIKEKVKKSFPKVNFDIEIDDKTKNIYFIIFFNRNNEILNDKSKMKSLLEKKYNMGS